MYMTKVTVKYERKINTDRKTLKPRLPRLGKLRKGGEKTANKPGADLDHSSNCVARGAGVGVVGG